MFNQVSATKLDVLLMYVGGIYATYVIGAVCYHIGVHEGRMRERRKHGYDYY